MLNAENDGKLLAVLERIAVALEVLAADVKTQQGAKLPYPANVVRETSPSAAPPVATTPAPASSAPKDATPTLPRIEISPPTLAEITDRVAKDEDTLGDLFAVLQGKPEDAANDALIKAIRGFAIEAIGEPGFNELKGRLGIKGRPNLGALWGVVRGLPVLARKA